MHSMQSRNGFGAARHGYKRLMRRLCTLLAAIFVAAIAATSAFAGASVVLRHPGRCLASVRPGHGRGARRNAAGARARRRPRHRALGCGRGGAGTRSTGTSTDAVLEQLHAAGIDAVVTLYGTPEWANGGKGPNVAPIRGADFAAFAGAAAERYPFVHRWTIWNEPNQRRWLSTASPAQYVTRLLNPAYAAIHAASPSSKVAGGVTAPRGGAGGLSPVAFIRGMGSSGARLDAYAHHPYALGAEGDAVERRLRSLRDDHDGDARPPRHRDAEGVQAAGPALADRARLPVESARPAPRRRARRAGVVHRCRRLQGLGDAARRSPDPVPLPRRADAPIAGRAGSISRRRRHEARARRVRGAARPGEPQGLDDCRVGNDQARDRREGLPPPAIDVRRLAACRRRSAHARGRDAATQGDGQGRAPSCGCSQTASRATRSSFASGHGLSPTRRARPRRARTRRRRTGAARAAPAARRRRAARS